MFSFKQHKTIQATAIYTLTDAVSKALSFMVLPFVSFYLVPEQLGIAANFDVMQQIISLLAGMAIVNGLPYFYYDRTKEEVALLVSALFFIILILNVLFSLGIFLIYGIVENYLHIGLSLQLLTIVSVMAQLITSMDLVLIRLEEKSKLFATFQICHSILHIVLLIFFVITLQMEALGKIYCGVISIFVIACIHILFLIHRKYLLMRIRWKEIDTLLRFGIPLLPHSLSFWMRGGVDKILLTTFCGLSVNGLYSMAMSFGAIYIIFTTSFNNAFVPYLQKRLWHMTPANEDTEKRNIVRLSYIIGGGFFILYFVVLTICYLAIHFILDSKYSESFQFMPWILLSLFFNAFYSIVIQYPYTVKKTLGLGIITFSGSLLQLILSYFLILSYGIDGIKISLVLGSFIIMSSVWWYSNKVYPMPWFRIKRK